MDARTLLLLLLLLLLLYDVLNRVTLSRRCCMGCLVSAWFQAPIIPIRYLEKSTCVHLQ